MTPTLMLDLFQTILENTGLLVGIAAGIAALRAAYGGRNDDQR